MFFQLDKLEVEREWKTGGKVCVEAWAHTNAAGWSRHVFLQWNLPHWELSCLNKSGPKVELGALSEQEGETIPPPSAPTRVGRGVSPAIASKVLAPAFPFSPPCGSRDAVGAFICWICSSLNS